MRCSSTPDAMGSRSLALAVLGRLARLMSEPRPSASPRRGAKWNAPRYLAERRCACRGAEAGDASGTQAENADAVAGRA